MAGNSHLNHPPADLALEDSDLEPDAPEQPEDSTQSEGSADSTQSADSEVAVTPDSPSHTSVSTAQDITVTRRLHYTTWSGFPVGGAVSSRKEDGGAPEGQVMGAEKSVLVIGPPRCGKTTAMVIPAVLVAPGGAVVTSTKDDVLRATLPWRSWIGCCYVFDPAGAVQIPSGAYQLRWSPVIGCEDFDHAVSMSGYLASAARPGVTSSPDTVHWVERAQALLAPLLHAAALSGLGINALCRWVWGHDVREPEAILSAAGATMPKTILSSIWRTEERERSGIFSTASGILSAYRSPRALEAASKPNFDPNSFVAGYDTVYVCSPSDAQHQTAPLIVALLEQIRSAVYARNRLHPDAAPVVFVLDEVANIAPLLSLPGCLHGHSIPRHPTMPGMPPWCHSRRYGEIYARIGTFPTTEGNLCA